MKAETVKSRFTRWSLNFFPAYRRCGARISYLSPDWQELHIRLPLNLWTRNYVGTLFGGSMFAAVDPIYMVMFIRLLGSDYLVWDKEATIRFLRPGRSTLSARFLVEDHELEYLRDTLADGEALLRDYHVQLIDREGQVCAEVDKRLYFRRKPDRGNR